MTWTYDITTELGKVRLRIGDTNEDDPLLSNEEIQVYIDDTDSDLMAAIRCVKAIMAKLARDVDVSAAGLNTRKTSRFQQYKELLADLQTGDSGGSGALVAATPFTGGISKTRQDTADSDSDFRPASFGVGMHDYEGNDDDPTRNNC